MCARRPGRPCARAMRAAPCGARGDPPGGRARRRTASSPSAAARAPSARGPPDPGQRGQLAVAFEHQVPQRPAREVRGRDAFADVAPAPRRGRSPGRHRPRRTSLAARRAPRTTRARSPPRRGREHRAELRRRSGTTVDPAVSPVAVGARAVPVGDAPAADRDAPVVGPLHVDVDVRLVADHLAALPADLLPDSAASGSVMIIELFIGTSVRRWPARLGRVALGRAHHPARAHRPGAVSAARGRISLDGGVLVITTPSRSTAAASPATSFAGWTRATCGEKVPARAPAMRTRCAQLLGGRAAKVLLAEARTRAPARRALRAAPAGRRRARPSRWPVVSSPASIPSSAAHASISPTVATSRACSAASAARRSGAHIGPRRARRRIPSPSRRCGPRRRSRRTRARARRSAASGWARAR